MWKIVSVKVKENEGKGSKMKENEGKMKENEGKWRKNEGK